jgi:hypothetical protein
MPGMEMPVTLESSAINQVAIYNTIIKPNLNDSLTLDAEL